MIETVETNKSDDQDGTFDRNYTEVKRITTLTSKNGIDKVGNGKDSMLVPVPDGTKVPFTGNMKIVYAYLFTFQDNEKRHNYPAPIHPNMEMIAWENGITKPTAQKAVDALMLAGVLIKDQIQVGNGFKSNNYVVLKPSKVVEMGIIPTHPSEAKSKNQKQQPEENNNGKSKEPNHADDVVPSTADTGESEFVQQLASDRFDDVSPDDEVSEEEDPVFPVPKAEPEQSPAVQTEPERADFINLEYWFHGGEEDREEYGRQWGKTKPGEITDLIHSHYRAAQKDKEKNRGFKSAANDEQPGADVRYRQQQEQNLAASRPANGFSMQDLNQIPY
ncbi:hypothetical protein RHD99_07775 [Buttiauxella selenatireducens]|uniref:Helix-turn-helix domain-containing protein n=1 Tax=Buttiauxella selenatireducens TaxID=3073902 RepID=A0ABY9SE87_9ENTR|nr:hypothetical protein [Buttiauxella sp. R73]WMY75828.1 hypothetical protein RHD99_07775 [Buttiauxella sp. R73]